MFKLKSFIEKLAINDSIYELDWDLLNEMGAALNFVAITITALQREDIYLSDVYAEWLLLIDQMKELRTEYCETLLKNIQTRFGNIFGQRCEPMLACISMDPRYQLSLNEGEKRIAKEHLNGLY